MTAPSGYGHGPPGNGSPLPLPTADPPAHPLSFASVRYRRPYAGSAPPPCGGLAGPGCAPADARFASLPASCSAMGWVPWAGALPASAQSVTQRPWGSSAVRAGAQDRRTECLDSGRLATGDVLVLSQPGNLAEEAQDITGQRRHHPVVVSLRFRRAGLHRQ